MVFGDTTTDRLIDSTWAGVYRVTQDTTGTDTDRPVMANTVSAGFSLPMGDYWIDWQASGSLASGPWAPPITITGTAATGNALQHTNTFEYADAIDGGSDEPQGFPFVIEATGAEVLFDNGPFVNSPGTGGAGADESILQNTTLMMSLPGVRSSAGEWKPAG